MNTKVEKMRERLTSLGAALPEARLRLDATKKVQHRLEVTPGEDGIAKVLLLPHLLEVAAAFDVPVERTRTMRYRDAMGECRPDGTIVLREGQQISSAYLCHVLAHELTHRLWHGAQPGKDPRMEEVEAECVAHLVTAHAGFVAADTPLYLASYHTTSETIERAAMRILADALLLAE